MRGKAVADNDAQSKSNGNGNEKGTVDVAMQQIGC